MLRVLVFALAASVVYGEATKGIVVLKQGDVDGKITFTQTDSGVVLEGNITGLSPGKHGFHIHEKGDLSGGCASAGGHFNPDKRNHGAPTATERHVGDLGNIVADANKIAPIKITDKLISLNGANSIIGRAVVVHADEDDLGLGGKTDSLTTGHAGDRVACGIIGLLEGQSAGIHPLPGLSIVIVTALVAVFNSFRI